MSFSAALFSPAQSKLLAWIFGQPERWFHVNELLRLTGLGSASLQRELKRLNDGGLLENEAIGNLRRVRAKADSPVYVEMVALTRKTLGLIPLLSQALAPFERNIDLALVYGSVAKGVDHAASDVDLLVVSDSVGTAELLPMLLALETQLGRRISPTVYSLKEFSRRRANAGSFVNKILAQPTLILRGTIDEPPTAR
jgi:predicted nucleotidyltransferase